jgi:Xaa-Pro dipeptidase
METVGSPQQVKADAQARRERVFAFLEREGLDALVLGRQDNFSWLTAGGDSRVITTSEMGFAYLVLTRDRRWLVSHSMDGQRFLDEQAAGQGYDLVTLYWHQGSPQDRVLELTRGMKVGADWPLPGARHYGPEIVDLHYPLSDLDLERCRWIGQTANRILSQVAHDLEPGISEQEVAAALLHKCALEGLTIDVLIVGFDDRIRRYRHPMPTENTLQQYALLHPAARRWGLHANITRLVHWGEPPSDLRRAMDGVAIIGAHVATRLAPGVAFADILTEQIGLYRKLGYSGEWMYHFQGGITGYTLADPTRCTNSESTLVERQAYDYFITMTGAKFEEFTLLTENGVEIASLGPGWPTRTIQTPRGEIAVPDLLIR